MKIRWFGHSCFLLESKDGTKIVTDPFDGSVGYKIPMVEADIVTVSHDHYDHNYVEGIQGDPEVVKSTGECAISGISIKGIPAFHDEAKGAKRGPNIIYTFEIDGIRVCHVGDLGHLLSKTQIEEIGDVDVIMIPVGGTFTLDADGAAALIEQLSPKITIPMHFRTPAVSMPIDPVDKFVEKMGDVEHLDSNTIEINPETLDNQNRIVVLNYE
ncbi:Zn-dependent hydrolase [Tepidanaerobacter acetatoxydans Re1]|uniref:Zn-dependent hydrolase n=1 Tax=Tepidanaerobacter acetatoxydans (strain DSM 21804 / JCM 16047 / Re1) TaxID=1209989 RepID=F4LTW2_TEPAE|nr:MBL fold metallo-hydrolase [Tepidanaerobacter acetatoxydans]AEE92559.1 Zn-dependent hydrolase [Tepidanaerobacter acetatoxydans Re1]CDI41042.1 Zn-dependent hydrolase [Tepidanaerobacter acetatoxydans Re1]